jgi:hypothetical protein
MFGNGLSLIEQQEFSYCWQLLEMLRLGLGYAKEIINESKWRILIILEIDRWERRKQIEAQYGVRVK